MIGWITSRSGIRQLGWDLFVGTVRIRPLLFVGQCYTGAVAKPRLFIGSSTERLPVAKALQTLVSGCADAKVWNEADEFALGESTLDGLVKVGQVYDFALLVFGQDDSAMIRGAEFPTVRDNVIFELGLLMGTLGRGRAFWLSPRGAKAPRTMTDLSGIIHLEFDEPALDDPAGISKSLLSIRDAIDKQIRLLGPRPADPLVREVQIKKSCASPPRSIPRSASTWTSNTSMVSFPAVSPTNVA